MSDADAIDLMDAEYALRRMVAGWLDEIKGDQRTIEDIDDADIVSLASDITDFWMRSGPLRIEPPKEG